MNYFYWMCLGFVGVSQSVMVILYISKIFLQSESFPQSDFDYTTRSSNKDIIGHHDNTLPIEYSMWAYKESHRAAANINIHGAGLSTGQFKSELKERKQPRLLVAIISGPDYFDRRRAIRDSWMKECMPKSQIICRFFTDSKTSNGTALPSRLLNKIKEEQRTYGDVELMDTPDGMNFAVRMIAVVKWSASSHPSFDYTLRIDDDHYLCVERLLMELPYRPNRRLYWGHVHCQKGIVRVDEGWLLLSSDLVDEFNRNSDNLLCHKYGDQAVAMWIYDAMRWKDVTWFGDPRIYHHPPAAVLNVFKLRKELCHTYLSLHGSYPIEMRVFHMIFEEERRRLGSNYAYQPVIDTCPLLRRTFDWKWFTGSYYAEPVPCGRKPIWHSSIKRYAGRGQDTPQGQPTSRHPTMVIKDGVTMNNNTHGTTSKRSYKP